MNTKGGWASARAGLQPRNSWLSSRGGALLAVLWLSAALSAIAFSVALSVRGESRRAENALDGVRAHYLATSALDRALNYMLWGPEPPYWQYGQPLLRFAFPSGEALVEIIPASSRLSVNLSPPEDLVRLLLALGVDEGRSRQITAAIEHWRGPGGPPGSGFDQFYLQQAPSFRSPHALIEQIEELLSVQGVTPDLLYGRYDRLPNGEAFYRPGLQDCLSVYSAANSPLDINAVEVPVMIAVGVSPPNALAVDQMRRMSPIRMQQWGEVSNLLGPAASRFRIGGDKVYILRSTARLRLPDGRLSDLRRTASLTVQTGLRDVPEGLRVLDRRENPVFVPHFQVWPQ